MFKLNIHNTYFTLFLLLLISISVFELHYILFLITCIVYYDKVSKKIMDIISYLLLIVIIAIISSFFNKFEIYDWVKDFAYFSKPILAILAGYLLAKSINNFKVFLKCILIVSLVFSVIHILEVFIFVNLTTANVSEIRKVGGISNEIEIFSLMLLVASKKYDEIRIINKKFLKRIILIILSISVILYFSRSMTVSFVIFLLSINGYLKITRKGIKYGSMVLFLFGIFYVYLFNADIKRGQTGIESFLYKMKNAPAEIFSPAKEIDTKNHAKLWDRWRAYEAGMAISQVNTSYSVAVGKGLGSLVDLKFYAPLGDKNMRYIPHLHNGYVTIYYKSGIIGIILYLLFILYLYLFSYFKTKNNQKKIILNLIGGLAIHYLFTTLIVTGIYNISETYSLILGMLLYYRNSSEENAVEK